MKINLGTNSNSEDMINVTFSLMSINPNRATPHPVLVEMGYANSVDPYFIEMMRYFSLYDRPVTDSDDNVITHWPDVQAAVANGIEKMDVYRADMTLMQLRRFIALKHKYHRRNLLASFRTVQFYETFLTGDPEGIPLGESMEGTTREKIAKLMHTSDSTIKRLKVVGENKPEKFGLIEQGYTSFKQVMDEIKAERLAAATAARKAAQQEEQPQSTQPETEEYCAEPIPNEKKAEVIKPVVESYYDEPVPKPSDESEIPLLATKEDEFYSDVENHESATETPIAFTDGIFTIKGLGKLEISITGNVPMVLLNGIAIADMSYMPVSNRESETGDSRSFVLYQAGKKGMSIQLTIENFPKAA